VKNYPDNRTIDIIPPVISHDKKPKNHYHEILQDRTTADEKKREYPVFRTDRKNPGRNFPTRQNYQTGTTPSPRYMEAFLMPRRPAKIERDIPLYLIPDIVKRGVVTHGQTLERVIVSKTRNHFYNVSIRTRPVRRELRSSWARFRIRERTRGDAEYLGTDDGSGSERG
jgi:hypothetical protein